MSKFMRLAALATALIFGMLSFASAQDELEPTVSFTLTTALGGYAQGPFAFLGVDEGNPDFDGVDNPEISVKVGDIVEVILVIGVDGMEHNFLIEELGVESDIVMGPGTETRVVFEVTEAGEFQYICNLPGHFEGGMYGAFIVEAE